MLGREWHEHRREAMLKSRGVKLRQLERTVPDADLFGFAREDHLRKMDDVKRQIQLLECDEYPIADFPEYINKIRQYL